MKIEIELEDDVYDTLQKIASQIGVTPELFIEGTLTASTKVMAPSGDPDPDYIEGMNAKFHAGLSTVERIQIDSIIMSAIDESMGDVQ